MEQQNPLSDPGPTPVSVQANDIAETNGPLRQLLRGLIFFHFLIFVLWVAAAAIPNALPPDLLSMRETQDNQLFTKYAYFIGPTIILHLGALLALWWEKRWAAWAFLFSVILSCVLYPIINIISIDSGYDSFFDSLSDVADGAILVVLYGMGLFSISKARESLMQFQTSSRQPFALRLFLSYAAGNAVALSLSWFVASKVSDIISDFLGMGFEEALALDVIFSFLFMGLGAFVAIKLLPQRPWLAALLVGITGWAVYFWEVRGFGGMLASNYGLGYEILSFFEHIAAASLVAYLYTENQKRKTEPEPLKETT